MSKSTRKKTSCGCSIFGGKNGKNKSKRLPVKVGKTVKRHRLKKGGAGGWWWPFSSKSTESTTTTTQQQPTAPQPQPQPNKPMV